MLAACLGPPYISILASNRIQICLTSRLQAFDGLIPRIKGVLSSIYKIHSFRNYF
jgi:hypothetical protein